MFKSMYARTMWLIFLSFSAIVLAAGYFRFWMPQREETVMKVANYNQHVTEANKLGAAVKKKATAASTIMMAEAKWRPFVETRTPLADTALNGINVNVNSYQLLLDTKRFRNSVQRALNKQLLSGGVRVIDGPRIPGVTDQDAPNSILASYYNYPSTPFPVIIHDLGQVTVQGTYEQIMAHVRSWASMPRYLAVAHNLALSGTAPQLTGTYDLSLVGYIRYDGIYPPLPDGSAPAANAPAPGANGPQGNQRPAQGVPGTDRGGQD